MPESSSSFSLLTLSISATSALLALLAKAAIDLFTKKNEFKQELIKLTYLRKLELAEKSIAFHWAYLNKITETIKTLEFTIKNLSLTDQKKYSFQSSQIVLTTLSQQIVELTGKEYYDIHGLKLYLDLDDKDIINEENIEKMIKAVSTAEYYTERLKILSDKYLQATDPRDENKWLDIINEEIPQYLDSVKKTKESIEVNQALTKKMISEIKTQMKTYQ